MLKQIRRAARRTIAVTRFTIKTALYRWTPGGFGYYRMLHRLNDPDSFVKHPVREKHHGQGGWQDQSNPDGIRYRDYASYEEYVVHQAQKFDGMIKRTGGFSNKVVADYRRKFYRRFKHLMGMLPRHAHIICAGARQGTEVEVLWDLGFRNASGIDLNPGPDNPYTRLGDFMHLDVPDRSVDLIYSNCVDHAFDLDQFFAEHARAIKPRGYVLYDLALGRSGGKGGAFEAVEWTYDEDIVGRMLSYFNRLIYAEQDPDGTWLWVLMQSPRERP